MRTCGLRIKAITPAFQAGDVGSIPIDRSNNRSLKYQFKFNKNLET